MSFRIGTEEKTLLIVSKSQRFFIKYQCKPLNLLLD